MGIGASMMRCQPIRYGVNLRVVPAPILSWRMNETSGPVSDYSGNGYTGRVDGTPTRAVAMGNGNSGMQLTASGHGVSLDPTTLSPVINAIRTGSYSQSIVLRNMGWSGAHTPLPFVIWNSASAGYEVTLFADYVPSSAASWLHRAGWDSASGTDMGNISFSYSPSSFDSQTFLLTYVWDDVTRTKSLYRDGVLVASAVLGTDYPVHSPSSERVQVGGHLSFPGSYQYYGKISDLNIWDVALTASEVATLASLQGRTPDQRTNIDPYAASVVSLLHFNGTDGSTTFTDVLGKTWTANGNAQIDTAQSKFGGASGLFDGSGDYIDCTGGTDFTFGTGDFTVEFWARFNIDDDSTLLDNRFGSYGSDFVIYDSTGAGTITISFFANGANRATTGALTTGVWYHFAVCRASGVTKCFLDGTQFGSNYTDTNAYNQDKLRIGDNFIANASHNGWIDELRITKGVARYTSNFTPPSAEFPNP